MKMTAWRSTRRIIAACLVQATFSFATARAEAVPWANLPARLGLDKPPYNSHGRQYSVVTRTGAIHNGGELFFGPQGLQLLDAGPTIPREQVSEIRIRRHRAWLDALGAPGIRFVNGIIFKTCTNEEYCILLVLALIPVAVGVSAAAAPVVLPVEAVKTLLPDRVIQVAP